MNLNDNFQIKNEPVIDYSILNKMAKHTSATNQVLYDEVNKVYYLPAYLRLNIKNFTQLNLQQLNAEMNATVLFSFFYGDLDDEIVDYLLQNIVFQLNRDQPIKLQANKLDILLKQNQKDKTINFTIRRKFTMRIVGEVFWSPFEVINLILTIIVQTVQYTKPDQNHPKQKEFKVCDIKFNLLDCQKNWTKISFSKEGTFGNYDLAQQRLLAQYTTNKTPKSIDHIEAPSTYTLTNLILGIFSLIMKCWRKIRRSKKVEPVEEKKPKKAKEQKIKNAQYAHFIIPLYKYPSSAIASIFLPLFILAAINLCIFFQQNDLAGRIASISALTIAFVSLIPNIKEQLPPNPRITFVEGLVFMDTFASFLCLIQSMTMEQGVSTQQLMQSMWSQNLLIISLILTVVGLVVVIIMYILHIFVWEPAYNLDVPDSDEKNIWSDWYNKQIDTKMKQAIKDGRLQIQGQLPIFCTKKEKQDKKNEKGKKEEKKEKDEKGEKIKQLSLPLKEKDV